MTKSGSSIFLIAFCAVFFSSFEKLEAKTIPVEAGSCAVYAENTSRSGALRLAVYEAKMAVRKKLKTMEKKYPLFKVSSLKEGFLEKYEVETSTNSSQNGNKVCAKVTGSVSFGVPFEERARPKKITKVKKQNLPIVPIKKVAGLNKNYKIKFLPVKFYNGAETDSLLSPVISQILEQKRFQEAEKNQKPDIIISPLVKQVDLKSAYSNLERLDITVRIDAGFSKNVAGIYEEKMISKIIEEKADEQEAARKMILQGFADVSKKMRQRLVSRFEKNPQREKQIRFLQEKIRENN
jgi:hypothetical protein